MAVGETNLIFCLCVFSFFRRACVPFLDLVVKYISKLTVEVDFEGDGCFFPPLDLHGVCFLSPVRNGWSKLSRFEIRSIRHRLNAVSMSSLSTSFQYCWTFHLLRWVLLLSLHGLSPLPSQPRAPARIGNALHSGAPSDEVAYLAVCGRLVW